VEDLLPSNAEPNFSPSFFIVSLSDRPYSVRLKSNLRRSEQITITIVTWIFSSYWKTTISCFPNERLY